MMQNNRIAIVIPVYNHGRQITPVVRECLALGHPVFVVDDGSDDETGTAIDAVDGIVALHHPRNLGKGAALLTGFKAARDAGCRAAVTLDGDGQHLPADIPLLTAARDPDSREIIIGCRRGMNADNKNVPWTSRFGRGFSNFWVRVAGGPRVSDSQSGFRLYPLPEVLELGVRARRYQFEVEVLVLARQHNIPVREVEVQVVYQKRGERVSHFRPWTDFLRNSLTFNRLIWSRLFRIVGK